MDSSSALHDYIAGAVGGAAGLVVGHPFDTTKVQLQTQQTSTAYAGTWDAIRNINKQGWTRGFFRGLGFPLASYGLINSVFFGVYGHSLRYLSDGHTATYWQVFAAGCVGGTAQLLVACPVDVVKVVLQSQIPHATGGTLPKSATVKPATYFRGPLECSKFLYRQGGFRPFFRGAGIMGLRDIPGYGLYIVIYEKLYTDIMRWKYADRKGIMASLVAGAMAGVLSWVVVMPTDTIKSLVQADVATGLNRGTWFFVSHLWARGGARMFYTGFVVNSIRSLPVNAITFLVYSQMLNFFREQQHKVTPGNMVEL